MKTLKFNSLLLVALLSTGAVSSVFATRYTQSEDKAVAEANRKKTDAKRKKAPQAVVENGTPKAAQKAEGESWYDYVAKKAAYVRDNKMESATTAAKYAAAAVLASATLYGANKGLEAVGAYNYVGNIGMVKSVMDNSAVKYMLDTRLASAVAKVAGAAQYPGSTVCGLLASGYNMASGYLTSAPAATPAAK